MASQLQLGHNAYIGVEPEATWGTFVTPTEFIKIISHGLKLNTPRSTRPTLGDPVGIGLVEGTKSTGGDIVAEMLYEGLESMLAYCLGIPVITNNDPEYIWTFRPKTTLWAGKGLSVEAAFDNISGNFAGNKVNSITFSMAKDQNMHISASLGGRSWTTQATPTTPTFPTDLPITESQFAWFIDDHAMAGSAETNIQSFNLTMSNALSFDRASLGSGYILEPQRNDFITITGSITADMLDNTWLSAQSAGTTFAFDVYCDSGVVIPTGANNYTFHIWLPQLLIVGDFPDVSGPGVVPQTINFQAVYDATATTALEIKIQNGKAAGAGDGV